MIMSGSPPACSNGVYAWRTKESVSDLLTEDVSDDDVGTLLEEQDDVFESGVSPSIGQCHSLVGLAHRWCLQDARGPLPSPSFTASFALPALWAAARESAAPIADQHHASVDVPVQSEPLLDQSLSPTDDNSSNGASDVPIDPVDEPGENHWLNFPFYIGSFPSINLPSVPSELDLELFTSSEHDDEPLEIYLAPLAIPHSMLVVPASTFFTVPAFSAHDVSTTLGGSRSLACSSSACDFAVEETSTAEPGDDVVPQGWNQYSTGMACIALAGLAALLLFARAAC
ncbi:hypothetical protein BD414DRAFT_494426 [Trametes punicea]|nr:hypothetical protein BD414DRAFT_494426 [Trametes punicea]